MSTAAVPWNRNTSGMLEGGYFERPRHLQIPTVKDRGLRPTTLLMDNPSTFYFPYLKNALQATSSLASAMVQRSAVSMPRIVLGNKKISPGVCLLNRLIVRHSALGLQWDRGNTTSFLPWEGVLGRQRLRRLTACRLFFFFVQFSF